MVIVALRCLGLLMGCSESKLVNPCVDKYSNIAGHRVGGPAGHVADIKAVAQQTVSLNGDTASFLSC